MHLTRQKIRSLIVCGVAGISVAVFENGFVEAIIVGIATSLSFRFGKEDDDEASRFP